MPEPNEPLSEREIEILRLVATGAANKEIARQLVISPNTVKVHLRNIFTKIGVASRTEATLYAVQTGLVSTGTNGAAKEYAAAGAPAAIAGDGETTPAVVPTQETPPLQSSRRRFRVWQVTGVALLALVLIASMIAGLRLLAPPGIQPTVLDARQTSTAVHLTRWSKNADLPEARKGMGVAEYENAFYVIAGETSSGVDGSVLRFVAANHTWETLASKPTPVSNIQAALIGEKIYVPGGRLADGKATTVLEVYNPRQNTWEHKAPLPEPVSAYALAAFEGQLYLFGGKNGAQYLSTVYIYNPTEDRWEKGSPLSSPRAYAGATVTGGKIQVVGGFDGQHALSLNQAYFPARDASGEPAWEDFAPLPQARYAMGTVNLASILYLLGGLAENGKPAQPDALEYLIQSNQWSTFDSPPHKIGAYPALLASGNYIYLLGGQTSDGLSAANQSYQAIFTIAVPILSGGSP